MNVRLIEEEEANTEATQHLQVLSWPGPGFQSNSYIATLCTALERAGAHVTAFTPRQARQRRWDMIHVHWAEQIFWETPGPLAAARYALEVLWSLAAARWRGATVVWTAHNLRPHEMTLAKRAIWTPFMALLLRLVDGVIAFTPSTLEIVRTTFPAIAGKPGRAIAHGHYRDAYPRRMSKADARQVLGLDADLLVAVHVGVLRHNKGVDRLIDRFMAIEGANARLVIAGKPVSPDYGEALRVLAAQDTRIQLHLGFQSAARLVLLLSAADLVVLPFEGGLHSGSLLLALTFGCPTLVRNTPYARDVASSVGERWIRLIPTALDTQMLRDALDWGRESTTDEGPSLEPFDWDAIGQQTCAFYAEVRAWRGLSTMPSH